MKKIEGNLYNNGSKVSIEIENGIIKNIESVAAFENENSNKNYIAPGLIDNQINGYLGTEFSLPSLAGDDMTKVIDGLYKKGVTSFLPTVITASHESLINSFANLAKARRDTGIADSIPGYHLEGPYITTEDGYRGVHSLKDVRKPDWDEFQKLNEAAEGRILQVTLAPEIEGAIEFIEKCVQNNIVISLGHYNATADVVKRAVDAGAKTVTHLGNGCANTINRFTNPFWMVMAEDRLMSSLILDGFHLLPEMVRTFYKTKGKDRIILTSDMTMLAGLPSGNYVWDTKNVVLTEEGIILSKEDNCFAGASLTLDVGVGNMMKFTGCSLEEAINMASKNPASLYNFEDRGTIEVGKRADLILFNVKDNKLDIVQTIVGGVEKK
jgi:N-acetylglucosamine-6-phosphate deacetylase